MKDLIKNNYKIIITSLLVIVLTALISFFSIYIIKQNATEKVKDRLDSTVVEKIKQAKKSVTDGDVAKAKQLLQDSADLLYKNGLSRGDPIPSKYGYYVVSYMIDNYNIKPTTTSSNADSFVYIQAAQ